MATASKILLEQIKILQVAQQPMFVAVVLQMTVCRLDTAWQLVASLLAKWHVILSACTCSQDKCMAAADLDMYSAVDHSISGVLLTEAGASAGAPDPAGALCKV